MRPFMPRTLCVRTPFCAFTGSSGVGGRGTLWSIMMFSCRLTILLPFVAVALCPEDANAQIQIFTRNLTPLGSRIVTLDVDSSDSIENVKQKNQGKFGYLPPDQFLFYAGNFLQTNRTLADYDIRNESIINMAVIDSFDALSFSGFLPVSSGFSPFMMRSGTSGAGVGWAVFNYANAIDLSATGIGEYTLSLSTVTPGGINFPETLGEMPGFDGQQAYGWTFITATGGISGFSPDQFVIDTGRFANAHTGSFSVIQQGNSLAISYVPEPRTVAMVLAGLACGGYSMFRRRKRRYPLMKQPRADLRRGIATSKA